MLMFRTLGGQRHFEYGFTIVELLVTIVIIGILATISIVAYNNVTQRSRDSTRKSDLSILKKALEMHYTEYGSYPEGRCNSGCKINELWSTTSDNSWSNLANTLSPAFVSSIPSDPSASTATQPSIYGGFNYDYVSPGG